MGCSEYLNPKKMSAGGIAGFGEQDPTRQPWDMASESAATNPDDGKTQDSFPGVTPDALPQYIQDQKAKINEFGPEQEKEVYDHVLKSQNSLANRARQGGKEFADAIMQGVAGAGNPGWGNAEREDQANRANMELNRVPTLNKMATESVEKNMALDKQTGGNPLGNSYIASLKPLMARLYPGMTEEEWTRISQNPLALQAALGPAVDVKKAEGELGMAKAQLDALKDSRKAQEETETERVKAEAAKKLSDEGILHRVGEKILHPISGDPVRNKLKEIAGIEKGGEELPRVIAPAVPVPQIHSDADFKALPSGALFKDGQGKTHRKK